MPELPLQQILESFSDHARLVKDHVYRQVWRFEQGGKSYYLKFYPSGGFRDAFRRLFRGSPALREFKRLQLLQKAKVPAPRAIASLMGFRLQGRQGDAVILEGLEPSIPLDQYFSERALTGKPIEHRREILLQVILLLQNLARARLGHRDLHLGNFLVQQNGQGTEGEQGKNAGKVFLLDAYAVHRSGLLLDDILLLGLSAAPWITQSELQRAWRVLGPGGPVPNLNRRGPSIWRSLVVRAFRKDRYFGRLRDEAKGWEGHFFKQAKFPHRWSPVSALELTDEQWSVAAGRILEIAKGLSAGPYAPQRPQGPQAPQASSEGVVLLKRTASGMVFSTSLQMGERVIDVVVKVPRAKNWRRRLSALLQGPRAARAWVKAWELIVRDIPTAWPLALVRPLDSEGLGPLIVMERVPGPVLSAISPQSPGYGEILGRCGRLLRRLERSGLYLYDAKATNWIIRPDEVLGPQPVLVDVDGVRRVRQPGGLSRLMRSLRDIHGPLFTPAAAVALARGYRLGANRDDLARLTGLSAAEVAGC